ncbi:MAG: DUF4373 domain-containing protein [Thermoguttaceae bacterium]|nr:DUF4373 domain-containing protein [Thermoguttaceae bacterium]
MTSQTRPRPIYPTRDLRSAALRRKLGARGYGVYCLILEEMANQCAEYLRYDLETLAWSLRASEKTIESVIKDFDLFELTTDGEFFRHREATERPKAENLPTERLSMPVEDDRPSDASEPVPSPSGAARDRPSDVFPTGSALAPQAEEERAPDGCYRRRARRDERGNDPNLSAAWGVTNDPREQEYRPRRPNWSG